MKSKKYLLPLLSFAVFCSCSQDEPMQTIEKDEITPQTNRVSVAEAIDNANQYMSTLPTLKTRGILPKVADVQIMGLPNVRTRSVDANVDTLLYIVNYEDNQGFAIMSADRRALPIYAISDTGHFEINEDSPEALVANINSAKYDVLSRIEGAQPVNPGWSLPPWPLWKGWDNDIEYKIPPKLSLFQSRMSYHDPYSKYCYTADGIKSYSGCVAIALEQILSFHKWPGQIESLTLNWNKINSGSDNEALARLLEILGRKDYLSLNYKTNEHPASGNVYNVPDVLKKLKYLNVNNFIGFYENPDIVVDALHTAPIFMTAGTSLPDGDGHAWVIDGMIRYKVDDTLLQPSVGGFVDFHYSYYSLYHCVWGWKGNCNGYYFQNFVGLPKFYDETDSRIDGGDSKYVVCDRNVKFLHGFYPWGVINQ